ncbi:MAG: HlyC/CorC family transporter [Chloroflexi bacterium]|nr:HlyC/CorC family transporter [Chloroflexota bacterium]
MDTQITIVLLVVFLGISAFFSSSETAFFALQRVRIQHLVASGLARAERVQRMKEDPERFLATVLLGNNLVNVALTALATNLIISSLGEGRQEIGIAIATAAVTIVIVIFGEAVPKTIAARHPERLAFLFIRPLEIIEKVLLPLATVLHRVSGVLARPFSQERPAAASVSEEELRMLVTIGEREGAVEQTQAQIILKAFRFGDLRAQEVMTPRTEIVWIHKDATLAEFLQVYAPETHTRFPVFESEQDNVIGMLYIKDVMKALSDGNLRDDDPVTPLMRTALFYPETKPVDDLFVGMRGEGTQIVMLVDEFGGIAGLLTLKQIVGEIVGRITEEEGTAPDVETIDDQTLQVDASMRVDEANERLQLGLPDGDYETLAGFLLAKLGHVPHEGEQVRYNGLRLVVSEMKGVKIERILVTRW